MLTLLLHFLMLRHTDCSSYLLVSGTVLVLNTHTCPTFTLLSKTRAHSNESLLFTALHATQRRVWQLARHKTKRFCVEPWSIASQGFFTIACLDGRKVLYAGPNK
ncbi:hypothetical protein KCU62_g374, partial [Aureobasidium sp. EXF-3399]